MKKIRMSDREFIAAVVPESASGPGWSNQPTWVYIVNHDTKICRTECIQPSEQTPELATLFSTGLVVQSALRSAIQPMLKKYKEKS